MMVLMDKIKPNNHTAIIIPAYQPGLALIESTNKLINAEFTVVVVNDGSEEGYNDIFSLLNKKVHIINHSNNHGKGASLKTGYKYIKDKLAVNTIITADADGQHRFSDIIKLAKSYNDNPRALLLGVRKFSNKNVPFKSRFGNIITRKIFALITKKPISDTQTGLRAFDKSLLDFMINIPGERFEYEMNVLFYCNNNGIDIVELPIKTVYENNNQGSHFNPIKDSFAIYKEVLKFASSSIASFFVDYGLYVILLQVTILWTTSSSIIFSNVVSRVISACVNFSINRRLIFNHKENILGAMLSYGLLAFGILFGNTLLLSFFTSVLSINPYLAKIATELIFFAISYSVQKNVIFAKKEKG